MAESAAVSRPLPLALYRQTGGCGLNKCGVHHWQSGDRC